MSIKEVLQISDDLFKVHDRQRYRKYSWYNKTIDEWIHLILYLRYMELFCKKYSLQIKVPWMVYCLNDCTYNETDKKNQLSKYQINCKRDLFFQFLLCCGWNYGCAVPSDIENPVFPMQVHCTRKEWNSMRKSLFKNVMNNDRHWYMNTIVICWNNELAWYLRFRDKEEMKVSSLFFQEDEVICSLLNKIRNGLIGNFRKSSDKIRKNQYVIGFVEENDYSDNSTFASLSYNLCIWIVKLDFLIKRALEVFQMRRGA